MVHTNVVHDYYLPITRAYYERYFPDRDDYFDIRYRVLSWRDVDVAQRATMRTRSSIASCPAMTLSSAIMSTSPLRPR